MHSIFGYPEFIVDGPDINMFSSYMWRYDMYEIVHLQMAKDPEILVEWNVLLHTTDSSREFDKGLK